RPEILELWIKAIRRENWFFSKSSRICGQHFLESDYKIRPWCSLKLLKPDAVPSVFSFPKHLKKHTAPRRLLKRVKVKTVKSMETTDFDGDVSNIPSTSQETNRLVDVGTQTQHYDELEVYSLPKKIKSLKQELNELQEHQQLRLANSLTSNHVNYKNKVINVQLAVQTLSSSVADALEFLQTSKHSGFQDSDATIEFIRIIDRLFPFGKGYKAPIRPSTLNYFEEVFTKTTKYLQSLSIDGTPILRHNRKTFAFGFIMTMQSTLGLARDLFNLEENALKYLLCYKCSQDHLELYFSCIRSRGRWNNNSNAMQLKWALRQLLFKNSVTCSINADCGDFGSSCTPVFEFRSESRSNLVEDLEDDIDANILQLMSATDLTYYQENVIYYISGYIVNKLVKKTTCNACVSILLFKDKDLKYDHMYAAECDHYKKFINSINHGGLLYASGIVYQIVQFVEKMFRYITNTEGLLNNKANIKSKLQNAAINNFASKLHLFKPKHPKCEEFIFEDLHELQLVKRIVDIFVKCRLHHQARLLNLK
ncbi:hypothetical protein ILUMI_22011, partial [Ignelater luminosus]